ncbi:MAG: peptide deformylase [Planctomycetaceae bacterium]
MRIVFYPDPVLKRRAEALEPGAEEPAALALEMVRVMREAKGVGLAAPQVGRSVRLFVASETGEEQDALICINPEIVTSGPLVAFEEGCLSLPGLLAEVQRPQRARLRAFDAEGRPFERETEGLLARIFQHEMDHLDGILFIDRISEVDRIRLRPDLKAFEEQYRPQ